MKKPAKFSRALADKICQRLAEGESLTKICESPGFPSRINVWRWLQTYPEFQQQHDRARQFMADCAFDELRDIANDASGDWKTVDGNKVPDRVAVDRARLKIDTLKWTLARINPMRYSERLELTGAAGQPLNPDGAYDERETVKILAFLAEEVAVGKRRQPQADTPPRRVAGLLPAPPKEADIIEKPARRQDPRFTQNTDVEDVVIAEADNSEVPDQVDRPAWLRHTTHAHEQGLAGGGRESWPQVIRRRP